LAATAAPPGDGGEVACRNPGGQMQDTFNAMARLSAAVAVFGVQQVQTAVGSADPKLAAANLRDLFEGMAVAVSAGIDESRLPNLDGFFHLSRGVAGRAWESTNGLVKTTSGWLFGMVKTSASGSKG
jgi:hypothetical protein